MYSITLTFTNKPRTGLQLQITGGGKRTVALEQIAAAVAIESTRAGLAALNEARRGGVKLPDPGLLIAAIEAKA